MFKNMKIGMRLGWGFFVVLLLMAGIVLTGIRQLGAVSDITNRMATQDWTKSVIANDVIDIANDNAAASFELFLVSARDEVAGIHRRMDDNKAKIDVKLEQLDDLLYLPEGKSKLATIIEMRRPYVASFTAVRDLLTAGEREQATRRMIAETLPALKGFLGAINDLIQFQGQIMENSGKQAAETYSDARTLMVVIGLIALIAGTGAAFWVARSITRPLGV
ncbi:MAG: MCP four helix bundle domain-containing protein, partial [Thiohalobacteraceae bacterium]